MFKLISRCQNVRRIARLDGHVRRCSTNSANQIDVDKAIKRIKLIDQFHKFKGLNTIDYINLKSSKNELDNLVDELIECDNVEHFLNSIDPHLTSFKSKHLELIYFKLNNLFNNLGRNRNRKNTIKKILHESFILNSLLDHTNNQIKKLDNDCLIILIFTFKLTSLDPNYQIVLNTMKELKERLYQDKLDNNQITNWLKNMHFYLNSNLFATFKFFKLNQRLVKKCRQLILNDQLDLNDENLVKKCFFIFLKPENDLKHQAIPYLIEKLLATDYPFTFELSISLLKAIKLNHNSYKTNVVKNNLDIVKVGEIFSNYNEFKLRYKKRTLFSRILSGLIDKCNATIYNKFAKQSIEEEDFKIFLLKLHKNIDSINREFPNFYDERIFKLSIPFLIDKTENKMKSLDDFFIFNLVKNYSIFGIYDERMLKLVYNQFCASSFESFFRSRIFGFFDLLSEYRLPFVDHHYLFQGFEKRSSFLEVKKPFLLRMLRKLILNDVLDENLFDCLIKKFITNNNQIFFDLNIKETKLAKSYLSIFGKLSEKRKLEIEQILDNSIRSFYLINSKMLKIENNYYEINNKLESNGYLSNGLDIGAFVIYDHSLKDFIPLTEYRYFFDKLDKTPLNCDQEM